jgi:hypothetical protein
MKERMVNYNDHVEGGYEAEIYQQKQRHDKTVFFGDAKQMHARNRYNISHTQLSPKVFSR